MSRLKMGFHNMYFLCEYVRCHNAKLDVCRGGGTTMNEKRRKFKV
jgi:hypothetical protein